MPLRWAAIVIGATAIIAAAGLATALVLAGRGDGEPQAQPATTATAAPAATSTPETGPYPIGTRTGIDVVDRVLEAVERGDPAQLAVLIAYYSRPCDNQARIGSLPCEDGDPEGTEYAVVGSGQGEGSFTRSIDTDQIQATASNFISVHQQSDGRVVGVAKQTFGAGPSVYVIVFANSQALYLDDRGINWFQFPARPEPTDLFQLGATFVLPPR